MELAIYFVAVVLGLLGLLFVVGSAGSVVRVIVGLVLMVAAGVMIYLTKMRPKQQETTIVQKIDLTGDVVLEQMKCRNCGGALSKDTLEVKLGAIYINCPYCGASYQVEEEPKW